MQRLIQNLDCTRKTQAADLSRLSNMDKRQSNKEITDAMAEEVAEMFEDNKHSSKKEAFSIRHGDDPLDDYLFDIDILKLNLSCKVIDKLNVKAAECAMIGDDDDIVNPDDISLKLSPLKQTQSYASAFQKI